jgi:large subunit ribosomal protein L31
VTHWYVGQVPVHASVAGFPRWRPGDQHTKEDRGMKSNIHPQYVVTQVTCSCGSAFTTRSTASSGMIHVETCNVCHPFYTGKQRVLDTAGRVAKFQQKYAKLQGRKAAK